jgi:hypothetical protein
MNEIESELLPDETLVEWARRHRAPLGMRTQGKLVKRALARPARRWSARRSNWQLRRP